MAFLPQWVQDFERCGAWLEAALLHDLGAGTLQDIFFAVCKGEMQFMCNDTAAMITTVQQYPGSTNIHIYLAGGDMAGVEALVAEVERTADSFEGVVSVSLHGRIGWTKSFLVDRGYTTKTVVMSKEIK